ncbi:hypothetical protein OW763_12025 [Clostridium aestuarii]|uniref:Uncharacterized protein n=1 Tax=Clostridium aestuarii TaxID=338193 RepID=A0ABT4D1E4_9CLOT|nr:hypothetical protein [Clostridium aestuarii]MCY6485066.1 hypothetical protein [Clostridium aestuarii]
MDSNVDNKRKKDIDEEYEMIPMGMCMPMEMQEMSMMPMQTMPYGMPMNMNCIPNPMSGMMMNQMMYGRNDMLRTDNIETSGYFDEDKIDDTRKKDNYRPNQVNRILRNIERYNPGIFKQMMMFGIPYPTAKKICRRIIRLTLMYYDD